MKTITYILALFILSSCATTVLRRDYKINVSAGFPNAKAEILDSVYSLPAEFKIRRSNKDLRIRLITDNFNKDYIVKASPNGAFLYGNLLWMQVSPAAYLIDFTNQKRFYYGKNIFLYPNDTIGIIRPDISQVYYDYWTKKYPTKKGQINLTYSFPWVNGYYLHPDQETPKIKNGFIGLSAGLEYFYKEKKYISLTGSAVMDLLIPFPAPIDYIGEYDFLSSAYLSLTDNYKFRRFTVGYGLNFSRNIWEFVYFDRFDPPPPTREPATKISNSIGFTLDGYHQIGKRFYIGLIYRPTFLKVYPNVDFKYEHLISLDFKFKIRIKK